MSHSFLSRYTEEDEWKKEDEGWEGIVDENEHYTDQELKEWEEEYYDYGSITMVAYKLVGVTEFYIR